MLKYKCQHSFPKSRLNTLDLVRQHHLSVNLSPSYLKSKQKIIKADHEMKSYDLTCKLYLHLYHLTTKTHM